MPYTFETLSFFRGTKNGFPVDVPSSHATNMDRKPRDTPKIHHETADRWFKSKFGIRYRSQALFVTSCWITARLYAASDEHVVRILPLTPYRFCWSPLRKDLLEFLMSNQSGESIDDFLSKSCYSELDLKAAHDSENEVMLHCAEYIAIPCVQKPVLKIPPEQLIFVK